MWRRGCMASAGPGEHPPGAAFEAAWGTGDAFRCPDVLITVPSQLVGRPGERVETGDEVGVGRAEVEALVGERPTRCAGSSSPRASPRRSTQVSDRGGRSVSAMICAARRRRTEAFSRAQALTELNDRLNHASALRNLFNRLVGQLYHCIQVHEPFDEALAFRPRLKSQQSRLRPHRPATDRAGRPTRE